MTDVNHHTSKRRKQAARRPSTSIDGPVMTAGTDGTAGLVTRALPCSRHAVHAALEQVAPHLQWSFADFGIGVLPCGAVGRHSPWRKHPQRIRGQCKLPQSALLVFWLARHQTLLPTLLKIAITQAPLQLRCKTTLPAQPVEPSNSLNAVSQGLSVSHWLLTKSLTRSWINFQRHHCELLRPDAGVGLE